MYPSSARLLLASLQDKRFIEERELDSQEALRTWDASAEEMQAARPRPGPIPLARTHNPDSTPHRSP